MTNAYVLMMVQTHWLNDISYRTVLYYAYLLTLEKGPDTNIERDLKRAVSLQDHEFPEVVARLISEGIMNDPSYTLTPQAMENVRILIEHYLGNQKPELNGLSIIEAPPRQRKELWIEAGSGYLIDMMTKIPGVQGVQLEDTDDPEGRFVVIHRAPMEASLLFWFMNMKRLTDLEPLLKLATKASRLEHQPLHTMGGAIPEMVIPIAAAPTYNHDIASACVKNEMRVIGPINLVAMNQQLINQPSIEPQHYNAITEFLMPYRGGIVDGIKLGHFFELFFQNKHELGSK